MAGTLEGWVTDTSGKPQMGATVLLFNRQERLCSRAITDAKGGFAFASLMPDLYSVRVSLARFLPAMRDHIAVQAGARSLLDVNLSTLFSSISISPLIPGQTPLMTDDWKWTLRSSSATRPVLRILADKTVQKTGAAMFSDSRGLVKVSGGDGGHTNYGDEADLGTAFAFATSLYERNKLQFSGNLAYGSPSGLPSGGFRTTFSRDIGPASPAISVTMRQLFVGGAGSSEMNLPPLRTLSVSFGDKTQISDALDFEYGFDLDSVSFVQHLHYFSPFAKLTYQLPRGKLDFTYTSGNARPELGMNANDAGADLQRDLTMLAVIPRVSLREGRAKVQRGENYELGYSRAFGSREIRVSGYREAVTNATLTMSGNDGDFFSGDILPDVFTSSSVFNAGNYHTLGYTASLTQNVGDNYKLTVMYGSVGVLVPQSTQLLSESPDDLRSMIHASRREAVTTRASGTIPMTGTHFAASYQWTDFRAVTTGHSYATQMARPEPGLNIYVRQPIPQIMGLPWRMEATADLSNLLAQGYLPLSMPDGRRLLLVRTPRSVRGGVSFTF